MARLRPGDLVCVREDVLHKLWVYTDGEFSSWEERTYDGFPVVCLGVSARSRYAMFHLECRVITIVNIVTFDDHSDQRCVHAIGVDADMNYLCFYDDRASGYWVYHEELDDNDERLAFNDLWKRSQSPEDVNRRRARMIVPKFPLTGVW